MNFTLILYIVFEMVSILFMYLTWKNRNDKIKKNRYFILSLLPFALLFVFRGLSVGKDYKTYADAYLSLIDGTLDARQSEWLSPGFKLVCIFLSFFFHKNFYAVFAIINILTLFLLYKSLLDNSENPPLSLFILFCFCIPFQIFNQFRQMLALSITFFSLTFVKKRKFFPFLITILIAGMIHTSAFVILPIYFLFNLKLDRKKIIVFLIFAAIGFVFFDFFKSILANTYYGRIYFGSSFDVTEKSSIYNLIVRLIMFGGSYFYYKNVVKFKPDANILYWAVFICTLLQLLVVKSYILARLTTYFYIYYILLIPLVLNQFLVAKRRKNVLFVLFVCGMILYQFVYYNSSSGAIRAGYNIYRTFFN